MKHVGWWILVTGYGWWCKHNKTKHRKYACTYLGIFLIPLYPSKLKFHCRRCWVPRDQLVALHLNVGSLRQMPVVTLLTNTALNILNDKVNGNNSRISTRLKFLLHWHRFSNPHLSSHKKCLNSLNIPKDRVKLMDIKQYLGAIRW